MCKKTRTIGEIIEELENCFIGHDEYILSLLAELKEIIMEGNIE